MNLLKALLESKKLQIAFANMLLVILNDKFGLGISPDTMLEIVGISCVWIISQGMSDFGKNKQDK